MNRSAKGGARSSLNYGDEGILIHPPHQGVCGRHEPDLFYILIRSCRFMDQVLTEKCTALINRYGASNPRNIRQRRGMGRMPPLGVDGWMIQSNEPKGVAN